jgi:hypothetical protein
MPETRSDAAYAKPEVIEVGDATELTGFSTTGNVSDGEPRGNWDPKTQNPLSEDE